MPHAMTATSGPMLSRDEAESHEADAVEREGAAADGDDASGEAVETVDQVDRVGERDDPDRCDERDDAGGEKVEAGEGDLELVDGDAGEVQDAGGEDLARYLRRRRHVTDVVDEADGEDGAGGEDDAQHLGRIGEGVGGPERREHRRQQHRDEEAKEHRRTAAVRDRLPVHRAIAGVRDVPNTERDALGRHGQRGGQPTATARIRPYQPMSGMRYPKRSG